MNVDAAALRTACAALPRSPVFSSPEGRLPRRFVRRSRVTPQRQGPAYTIAHRREQERSGKGPSGLYRSGASTRASSTGELAPPQIEERVQVPEYGGQQAPAWQITPSRCASCRPQCEPGICLDIKHAAQPCSTGVAGKWPIEPI